MPVHNYYYARRSRLTSDNEQLTLCVINTGGTISCVGDPLAPMTAADFATASQAILDPVIAEEFPQTTLDYETDLVFPESSTGTLDSTNLQPEDWCRIAEFILDNYDNYDGFVVLHGTDSMDFTGSALPFLLNVFDDNGFGTAVLSKPVIITGSQVPMYYQPAGTDDPTQLQLNFNTDAYQNFCGAVACARLKIPEVCVYFDTRLYRGNRVLKVNASEFQAFDSPNYPAMAQYGIELMQWPDNMLPGPVNADVSLDNDQVRPLALDQLAAITATINSQSVMPFSAFPAWFNQDNGTAFIANLINACVGQNLKGLVLQSYGEGNFPSGNPDSPEQGAIYQALDTANQQGVVIIDSTQVIAGMVNDSAYAAGAWLPAAGALSAFDMTSITALTKATALLSAAATQGWSADTVKTLLQLNLTGEMENISRLDSRTNSRLLPGEAIAALDGSATLTNDPVSGPQLTASDGTLLWTPFGSIDQGQPGTLIMQNDGNLVLYSSDNVPLWATNTGVPNGASSVLMISGSYGLDSLQLSVYDYSGGQQTSLLYAQ